MFVTLSGIIILVRELHPSNADSPILFTPAGISILVRKLQSLNA